MKEPGHRCKGSLVVYEAAPMTNIILALIVSAYRPHPYSWRNGCDHAWREVYGTLWWSTSSG